MIHKLIRKRWFNVLTIAFLGVMITAQPALATDIEMASVSSGVLKTLVQNVATIIGAIGAGVIMIFGMLHTFKIAGSGTNATKRQMSIEALGYVFLAIFVFFALSKIGGVIRGLAESI